MTLPRFYPVFDSAAWVARATGLGVRLTQLRLKDMEDDALRREIASALDISRQNAALLVVNDHWQHAIDLGAEWVHLGQEDLDTADVPAIRRAGLKLGISTHDDAELDRALSFSPDYVALGPVYPTILKEMPWAPQGLDKLKTWKAKIGDIPLCAIGGMSAERAPGAFDAGADLIAAVTDITLNEDPDARMRDWLKVCA
ncbi:thiamine phosphate synthase [Roseovarius aestuariivivens]|uniref:thiamine phosphate synthase n=1 Tax=Roseovarius aestuariivivens TaxID=1888910 RepID=UPI0010817FC6|nr:thiamine phosphate synthase [Roseovarius aestuariivivens]